METGNRTDFKKHLYEHVTGLLAGRIAVSKSAVNDAQATANEEGKSSAGDKYETSRAMSHLDKEMYGRQLEANTKEMTALLSLDVLRAMDTVSAGSLIDCGTSFFFIAAGIGRISFMNQDVYCLSPVAPLAQALKGKKAGDVFRMGKNEFMIKAIC